MKVVRQLQVFLSNDYWVLNLRHLLGYGQRSSPFCNKQLMLFQNAFSERLGPHGFEFHSLFTPDLLHEFELGVWKAVFIHLIRLLYAVGGDGIQILNERYDI
jgi:hypothetical protein